MSEYFLGIDGGQSATVALIGDERGRVVGVGRAGPCTMPGAIHQAIGQALNDLGLAAQQQFSAACAGLSGGVAGKETLLTEWAAQDKCRLTHDAEIALDGALAGEPGVIVIAGTGSIAFGRDAEGKHFRAGGWGYVFGDEGGAFDIVRQALRAALRAEEGWGPRTVLGRVLLEASGAASANELLHWAYGESFPRQRVAGWAPLVEEAANAGDPVAAEILRGAGQQLAMMATAARRQMAGELVRVSYAGGVFKNARVMEAFETLAQLDGSMEIVGPSHQPAVGALIGAYRVAGKTVAISGAPASK